MGGFTAGQVDEEQMSVATELWRTPGPARAPVLPSIPTPSHQSCFQTSWFHHFPLSLTHSHLSQALTQARHGFRASVEAGTKIKHFPHSFPEMVPLPPAPPRLPGNRLFSSQHILPTTMCAYLFRLTHEQQHRIGTLPFSPLCVSSI